MTDLGLGAVRGYRRIFIWWLGFLASPFLLPAASSQHRGNSPGVRLKPASDGARGRLQTKTGARESGRWLCGVRVDGARVHPRAEAPAARVAVLPESSSEMGCCKVQPAQNLFDRDVETRNDPAEFPKLNSRH